MDKNMPESLKLTIKKKWFDLIASGEKTVEYREYKPYWIARLLNKDGSFREYNEVLFRNGYSRCAPAIRVEFLDCKRLEFIGCPQHGEIFTGPVFAIKLGKVLEIKQRRT